MSEVKVDTISERTAANGIVVDGVTIKDSGLTIPSGGTLTVASGGTITNSGTATGFGGDNTPSFRAYPSSTQSISTSTWTKVTLDSEEWDTDSAFDSTTNSRFTVPTGEGGKYVFHYGTYLQGPDDGEETSVRLYLNGSPVAYSWVLQNSPKANCAFAFGKSVVINLSASDYVELWIYHNTGSSKNSEPGYTYFVGYKLIGV